jgi:sirohydrochlorin ferrochelatase
VNNIEREVYLGSRSVRRTTDDETVAAHKSHPTQAPKTRETRERRAELLPSVLADKILLILHH